jgi:2-polyprenyl-3-methyl-5-hydroxy-6-metoxy-1,4-benzoquinol methylase
VGTFKKVNGYIMRLAEKILLSLSRGQRSIDYLLGRQEWNMDNALSLLCRVFPNFLGLIKDKEILDFGCGGGYQVIALAKSDAKYVVGIDINHGALSKAQDMANALDLQQKVKFSNVLEDTHKGKFDIVITQNSMEHFRDPIEVLLEMKSALKKEGVMLITFGPLWFAPYGSHMQFFTKLPWINLLFSEETVMKIRSNFRHDGAKKYEEVEGRLNRMTVTKFENIIATMGLVIEYKRYDCVKGFNFLGKIPFLRELFINHITCLLRTYEPLKSRNS